MARPVACPCGIVARPPRRAMPARHPLLAALLPPPSAPVATAALLTRLWNAARAIVPPVPSATLRGAQGPLTHRGDAALFADYRAGDAAAFEALMTRHLPRLVGYAARHLAAAEADDAVQAALLVVIEKAPALTGDDGFLRYVFRALTLEVHRRSRAAARAAARAGALDDELADGDAPAPDGAWLRRAEVTALAAAFDACLDPVDQELLLRCYDGDDDAAALGEALGLTSGNVRVRKHRALRRLAAWFEARGAGGG